VFGLNPIDPRPDARRTVCLVLHSRSSFWFLILYEPPNIWFVAASAALNDKQLLKTKIAAAVGLSKWFGG
jgi:hypothetical protein